MKTYVLVYSANALYELRGVQKRRFLRSKEFECSDIDEAKKQVVDFLRSRTEVYGARFVSFSSKHEWKPES